MRWAFEKSRQYLHRQLCLVAPLSCLYHELFQEYRSESGSGFDKTKLGRNVVVPPMAFHSQQDQSYKSSDICRAAFRTWTRTTDCHWAEENESCTSVSSPACIWRSLRCLWFQCERPRHFRAHFRRRKAPCSIISPSTFSICLWQTPSLGNLHSMALPF